MEINNLIIKRVIRRDICREQDSRGVSYIVHDRDVTSHPIGDSVDSR